MAERPLSPRQFFWSLVGAAVAYRAAIDARWAAKQAEFRAFDASMDAEIARRRIYA